MIEKKKEKKEKEVLKFKGGLKDYMEEQIGKENKVKREVFEGRKEKKGGNGEVEWEVEWLGGDGFVN